ncbi:hypothetical protein [Xanthomonas translucens]|uniref:hypothetical protein n=1 Tax=Xanthomonas campestris pv. translucens TaxID=343 RepID=UPI0012D956BE|nr:hypothetical protein [Xanthomonas translucens]UPU50476.1 hypothetical protein MZO50_08935 [Xanthomonas translucens pv. undulosa]WLA03834.1 hypothetical protein MO329_14385 [Xanthomonas translucens]
MRCTSQVYPLGQAMHYDYDAKGQPLPDSSALTGSAAACDAQAPGRSGLTEATA